MRLSVVSQAVQIKFLKLLIHGKSIHRLWEIVWRNIQNSPIVSANPAMKSATKQNLAKQLPNLDT